MNPAESQHLEYKRELSDGLEREVVAFLNHRDGGRILIGVDDAGAVVGLSNPDGDQLNLEDKELMRVFRDLDMVEYLGSGMPCILRVYPKECFRFTENFTRMVFPAVLGS
jgi:predicted HTH transcriptional regulator